MHGLIDGGFALVKSGFSQSSFTYNFASSLPAPFNTTILADSANSNTSYTTNSSDFYDASSYESQVAFGITNLVNSAGISFDYLNSTSADIQIIGLNTTLYNLNAASVVGGFVDPSTNNLYLTSDTAMASYFGSAQRVISHELGHTVGLSDIRNTGPTSTLYGSAYDNGRFTMMSFALHPGLQLPVREPQLYDIAALQSLHGQSEYNATNTTYSTFQDSLGDRMYSIWDSGGSDTIDASTQQSAALIDLRPGYFSSIGNTTSVSAVITDGTPSISNPGELNVSIAFGAYIENAIGTDYNDLIIGNLLSNIIHGGDGNDIIYAQESNSIYDQSTGTDYRQITSAGSHLAAAPTGVAEFVADSTLQIDQIYGDEGNDYIQGGDGDGETWGVLDGGSGNDIVKGGNGGAYIIGGEGNDLLISGANNELDGGEGNDILVMNANWGGWATGGSGNDAFYITGATADSSQGYYITDSDVGDSLYWNGYRLTGGPLTLIDYALDSQTGGGANIAGLDSNGFQYVYWADVNYLAIFCPGGSTISIVDFQNGDLGITVDPWSGDGFAEWSTDQQQWVLTWTGLQSNLCDNNVMDDISDLDGYSATLANQGPNEVPSMYII